MSTDSAVGSQTARSDLQQLHQLRQELDKELRIYCKSCNDDPAVSTRIEACRSELLQEREESEVLRGQLATSERTELSHAGRASALYSQIDSERNFVIREIAAIAAEEARTLEELSAQREAERSEMVSESTTVAETGSEAKVANMSGHDDLNVECLDDLRRECHSWGVQVAALADALHEVEMSAMQEADVAAGLRAALQRPFPMCFSGTELETEVSELRDECNRIAACLADAGSGQKGLPPILEAESTADTPLAKNSEELEAVQREQELQEALTAVDLELEHARALQKSDENRLEMQVQCITRELEASRRQASQQLDHVLKLEAHVKRLEEERALLRAKLDKHAQSIEKSEWMRALPARRFQRLQSVQDKGPVLQTAGDDVPNQLPKPRPRRDVSPFIRRKLMQHDLQLHKFLDDILPKAVQAEQDEESPSPPHTPRLTSWEGSLQMKSQSGSPARDDTKIADKLCQRVLPLKLQACPAGTFRSKPVAAMPASVVNSLTVQTQMLPSNGLGMSLTSTSGT